MRMRAVFFIGGANTLAKKTYPAALPQGDLVTPWGRDGFIYPKATGLRMFPGIYEVYILRSLGDMRKSTFSYLARSLVYNHSTRGK